MHVFSSKLQINVWVKPYYTNHNKTLHPPHSLNFLLALLKTSVALTLLTFRFFPSSYHLSPHNCKTSIPVTKNFPVILSISTFTFSQVIPTLYLLHIVHPSYIARHFLAQLFPTAETLRSSMQNLLCQLRNTPEYRGNKLMVYLLL